MLKKLATKYACHNQSAKVQNLKKIAKNCHIAFKCSMVLRRLKRFNYMRLHNYINDKKMNVNIYLYIYIYIYRERER